MFFLLTYDITHRVVGVVGKLIKYVTFNNSFFSGAKKWILQMTRQCDFRKRFAFCIYNGRVSRIQMPLTALYIRRNAIAYVFL